MQDAGLKEHTAVLKVGAMKQEAPLSPDSQDENRLLRYVSRRIFKHLPEVQKTLTCQNFLCSLYVHF